MQTEKDLKRLQDITPGKLSGTKVVDGNIDRALRKFKKTIKDSGIIQETFYRREYRKPSVIRRKQIKDAIFKQGRYNENNF